MKKTISKILSLVEWTSITLFAKIFATDLTTGTKIFGIPNLKKVGSSDSGWIIPVDFLDRNSICYSAGIGEDLTFDLELIIKFDCEVFAFDPTPGAKAQIKKHARNLKNFHYQNIGLWREEDLVRFYHHSTSTSPSYSIVNLHKTNTFVKATCKRLSTIMKDNRHKRIDLLKLDIEGAEYGVLDSIMEDCLDIGIILVDYDEIRSKQCQGYRQRIIKSAQKLCDYGYTLVALKAKSSYTFVKKDILISYLHSLQKKHLPPKCHDSVVYEPANLY